MRLRFFGIALGLLFFVPAVASADAHRWGFGGGGSGASGSKRYGFYTSGEVVVADFIAHESVYKYVTLIGDFAMTGGSHEGVDITRKTGGVGPGLRFSKNATSPHVGGTHAIFGKATSADGQDTRFATAIGGLYEFVPHRDEVGWETAFRVQYDYVISKGDGNSFHRFSFGGVIRFKKQH
jgi:hypothetical protein